MTRLSTITARERDDALAETVGQDELEVAGAVALDTDEAVAFTALRAAASRDSALKLAQLYRLLHAPNAAEISALLSNQSRDPAALQTAATIYTASWFEQRPWANYHKAEFAAGLLQMFESVLGQTNSTWSRIAAQD